MKTNKILYILSLLMIIVSGSIFTSCTAEEYPHKQNIDNIIDYPSDNIVPDKLEGYYISPNKSDSKITITETDMFLNLIPYLEKNISFDMVDVASSETSTSFTVEYSDTVTIIFNYIKDSKDITVIYEEDGVIYDLGQFTKQ